MDYIYKKYSPLQPGSAQSLLSDNSAEISPKIPLNKQYIKIRIFFGVIPRQSMYASAQCTLTSHGCQHYFSKCTQLQIIHFFYYYKKS